MCDAVLAKLDKLRNMVDAQALLEHKVFPEDLLSAKDFQRPTKNIIQYAHKVRSTRRMPWHRVHLTLMFTNRSDDNIAHDSVALIRSRRRTPS